MSIKTKLLKQANLYCVLDAQVAEYDQLFNVLDVAADAGVDIFQIRDKHGTDQAIEAFTQRAMQRLKGKQLFIVNDRIDAALRAQADGVHLGQEDMPVQEARGRVPAKFLIGASCQTLEQAYEAERQGADYIGFGSVFKTQTKPERDPMDLNGLADVLLKISIPVFPIGGITPDNYEKLRAQGAKRVAVTRAICLADDVEEATRALKRVCG